VDALDPTMLLLADTGFDAAQFLRDVGESGAQFLVRSSARRCPTIQHRLPDGSYLARIGYAVPILARVIEAQITITLTDGILRREQWRLITSLLNHCRYPARELVNLYHERWQAETTHFSIKATMLDGRVLRSRSVPGLASPVRPRPSASRRASHSCQPAGGVATPSWSAMLTVTPNRSR
jgi:hypothetical protein